MARLLLDLTPLRVSPAYRRLWLGTSLSAIGTAVTTVVVGLQVYDLTGSTFSVGLVGLFALVPLVVLGLYGGTLVDAHDRRTVLLLTSSGLFVIAVGLAVHDWSGLDDVRVLYALVAVQSGLFGVNSPARSAIVPRLVGLPLLPAANALSSLSGAASMTLGPLLAAFLVTRIGFGGAYALEAVLLLVALQTVLSLPRMPPEGPVRRAGLGSVLEGLRYLGTQPVVRATFVIDIIAMVMAMPRVLFPAIGAVVLGGGATTVALLVAGLAGGSVLAGLLSGPLGTVRRQGRAVIVAVVAWGLSVVLFGGVLALAGTSAAPGGDALVWAAVGCMVLAGAADMVSAVFRTTILQSATPDAMRGRLQGVFVVVVAGGPRLGDLVLGGLAECGGEAFAALVGGVACVVGALVLAALQPGLRRYEPAPVEPPRGHVGSMSAP